VLLLLLQFVCSWNEFTAGFTVGALSGVAWAYACTQFLPYYS
jgi:photosystem I subunit 11